MAAVSCGDRPWKPVNKVTDPTLPEMLTMRGDTDSERARLSVGRAIRRACLMVAVYRATLASYSCLACSTVSR